MEDYKSNSFKSKETPNEPIPEKKIEKVTTGKVVTKKHSGIRKFADVFVSEDVESVKSYILLDVLVPAVKKAISDIVTNGIDMILYGENGSNNVKKSTASKISYQRYYDDRRDDRRHAEPQRQLGYSYDDIIIESRGEAEDALSRMSELVDTYGMVTVADMCDLLGVTCRYTDNKYGWTDIHTARIVRTRDGYMIKLPRAMPID